MDAPPTIPTVDPPKLSSMFAQISSFNKNNMQKTTTRVRTSLGQVFEETYNKDSLHGFTRLIPGKYDPENKKWINFIYNSNITLNTQPTQSISFISFNCWFSPIYQKERAIAFLDIVAAKHPTFICLQEVTTVFLSLLKENIYIQDHYYISDVNATTVDPYGTMILSCFPITSLRIHKLPTNQGRRLLDAEVTLEDSSGVTKTLRSQYIATIHLESLANQEMRIAQLDMIFPILDKYENAFFMGDFNFIDGTLEESHFSGKFKDLWKEVEGPGTTTTTGQQNSNHNNYANGYSIENELQESVENHSAPRSWTVRNGRYDRILYSSNIFVGKSAEIIGNEPLPGITKTLVYPSDHKGIIKWREVAMSASDE